MSFETKETHLASPAATTLFARSFTLAIPNFPRHFELCATDGQVVGYVHFTRAEKGVYLCGGLCIDARLYRRYRLQERASFQGEGTWSRQLLRRSIDLLGQKRAVFAYSDHRVSVRDIVALGFIHTPHRFLYAQWHSASRPAERAELVDLAHAVGAF